MTAEKANGYDHHRGSQPLLRPTRPWRMAVFLTVNLAAFVVASAFWQYLSTGEWADLRLASYYRSLATPLGEVLLHPLNVFTHPWMIFVTGSLLAVILFVPPIIAVFYHLYFAAIFVVVVAVVGHAPVLAAALAIGCLLAAETRLRSNMPFLAFLLATSPIALYLYFFSFTEMDSAAVLAMQRWVLALPMVIALVAAVAAAAVVFALARLSGYRPGVVWPVLVLLLAAPMCMFYLKVGPDELKYCLIADSLAEGDALYRPESLEGWLRSRRAEGLNQQTAELRVADEFHRLQRDLEAQCDGFLAGYPRSRHVPAVLWIKAQCRSLQIDQPALRMKQVKYSCDYPLPPSQEVWEELVRGFPSSPHTGLAEWRLGQMCLREGDVEAAVNHLQRATAIIRGFLSSRGAQEHDAADVFSAPAPVPPRRYYSDALFDILRTIWIMKNGQVEGENPKAVEAMKELRKIDPFELPEGDPPERRLRRLADSAEYRKTPMGSFLRLIAAEEATTDARQKAAELKALAADGSSAAAVEANYKLGQLILQERSLRKDYGGPESYFEAALRVRPGDRYDPWPPRIQDSLDRLQSATQPKREK
jgi:hypothetical protein